MSANETINSCCRNIENAESKEERNQEVERLRNCCSDLSEDQQQEVMACCSRIENTDSKEEIAKEVEKIRSCCA